jgi:Protein of unknown function (DUF2946)
MSTFVRLSFAYRRLVWAVLCAVCFAALAPCVSALLAAKGSAWVEVCTAQGSQMRLLQGKSQDDGPAHAGNAAHCPYCLLHQDMATPPQVAAVIQLLPPLSEVRRWQALALPYQAVAWSHRPSRAPPSFA